MSLFLDRSELEALYDRHGSDVFNFCLRVASSREVAAAATEAAFLEVRRDRADLVALLAAARRGSAPAVEPGAGHDPASNSPLEVVGASARLEPRYREVLALRELVGCTYEEMGRIVDADRATVAELLWQARLELRDELEGSTLRSIAPVASSCRRALALIAMSSDGELHDPDEQAWLQRHLRTCGKCRLSREAARQASAAYREWPPAAMPLGMGSRIRNVEPAPTRLSTSKRPP